LFSLAFAGHWIPPDAAQVLRTVPFALFLVLGARVALARDEVVRRRRVNVLFVGVLAIQAIVGATQIDAWPFSPHRLMAADVRQRSAPVTVIALRGLDSDGREWRIDPLAWSPLYSADISDWFEVVAPRAAPSERDAVLAFLYARAEEARRLRAAGRRVGNERWLGPLAAPDIFVAPPSEGPPPGPFAGLKVYRLTWNPADYARHPEHVDRQLLAEYRVR